MDLQEPIGNLERHPEGSLDGTPRYMSQKSEKYLSSYADFAREGRSATSAGLAWQGLLVLAALTKIRWRS